MAKKAISLKATNLSQIPMLGVGTTSPQKRVNTVNINTVNNNIVNHNNNNNNNNNKTLNNNNNNTFNKMISYFKKNT